MVAVTKSNIGRANDGVCVFVNDQPKQALVVK